MTLEEQKTEQYKVVGKIITVLRQDCDGRVPGIAKQTLHETIISIIALFEEEVSYNLTSQKPVGG